MSESLPQLSRDVEVVLSTLDRFLYKKVALLFLTINVLHWILISHLLSKGKALISPRLIWKSINNYFFKRSNRAHLSQEKNNECKVQWQQIELSIERLLYCHRLELWSNKCTRRLGVSSLLSQRARFQIKILLLHH